MIIPLFHSRPVSVLAFTLQCSMRSHLSELPVMVFSDYRKSPVLGNAQVYGIISKISAIRKSSRNAVAFPGVLFFLSSHCRARNAPCFSSRCKSIYYKMPCISQRLKVTREKHRVLYSPDNQTTEKRPAFPAGEPLCGNYRSPAKSHGPPPASPSRHLAHLDIVF